MSAARSVPVSVRDAFEARTLIITIDGPAGTGKSSVAHRLAKALGLEFLDTGAMYRAASVLAMEEGIDPADGGRLAQRLRERRIAFDWRADPPRILLDRTDVSRKIRLLAVSEIVSIVAACPEVRAVLIEAQRRLGAEHPRLVSEGRDQGSVVFPDADVRFFLTASPQVRALRRLEQLRGQGMDATLEAIEQDIRRRDALDSTRAVGPLVCPVGATVIDSTGLTMDEVVARMVAVVQRVGTSIEVAPEPVA